MSFNPYAGSDGRLKSVAVAPNLTVPMPDYSAATPVAVAGIRSWKISIDVESPPILHFETPANAQGVLFEQQIQGGTGKWSVDIEGLYDGDAGGNTSQKFTEGAIVVMDLVISKATNFRRPNCVGKVMSVGPGVNLKENSAFTARIAGHGVLPAPTL